MNQQKPIKKIEREDGSLFVHSVFETIQGEGPLVGSPAIFVRLYGCNLQCPLCDTDYTSIKELLSLNLLTTKIDSMNTKARLLVITGGEPLLQNLQPLITHYVDKGFTVQIETNGTIYNENIDYEDVVLVCSPKTPKVNLRLQSKIKYYKYVGGEYGNQAPDGLPVTVLGLTHKDPVFRTVDKSDTIYLQPVDESCDHSNTENLKRVTRSCIEHGYRLGIQLHKIAGVL